jgi:hypothetical protein
MVSDDIVIARAEFSKSLPFSAKLRSFEDKLVFGDTRVASFGTKGRDNKSAKIVKIYYYKDDDNFIIGLQPEDVNHEILLTKSDQRFSSLHEIYHHIQDLVQLGIEERQTEEYRWKYELAEDDEVIIPKFSFHVESNFPALEGQFFQAGEKSYKIETAWQRTAFLLDESGAKIESQAEFEILSLPPELDMKGPKKMVFDEAFSLFLKRKDAMKPYFGLWVVNSELIVAE